MKLTKKSAKKLIDGWEYIQKFNQRNQKQISKEEYIEAFFQTLKEGKDFCVKCDLCNKCE